MAFCTQCGSKLEPGSSFCTNCGAKVDDSEPDYAGAAVASLDVPTEIAGVATTPIAAADTNAEQQSYASQSSNFVQDPYVTQQNKSTQSTQPMPIITQQHYADSAVVAPQEKPKRRWLVPLIIIIVAVLVAGGIVGWTMWQDQQKSSSQQTSSASAATTSSTSKSTNSATNTSASASTPLFTTATASSELAGDQTSSYYGALNVIDGDDTTAWNEGASNQGIGEWVQISASSKQEVSGIEIVNGYSKSLDIYDKNCRPKDITISFSDGTSVTTTLSDEYATAQKIKFENPVETSYVKVTIDSIYTGTKYDDCCISEITAY